MKPRSLLAALIASPILVSTALATPTVLPFPYQTTTAGTPALMTPRVGALEQLEGLTQVMFKAVELPGDLTVNLALERVPVVHTDSALYIDGAPQVGHDLDEDLSLWSGTVVGDSDSSVFLGFSPYGSRGFLRTHGRLIVLGAMPGPSGGWHDSQSFFGDEVIPIEPPMDVASFCATDQLMAMSHGKVAAPKLNKGAPIPVGGGAITPILEARIALETDYQYFQGFADVDAARTYLLTLFGAVSDRFREQIGVILTTNYIGLYTNSSDPWFVSDSSSPSCLSMLDEFKQAWEFGGGPVNSDLYSRVTGSPVSCGVAYLPGICSQEYGFSVCVGWGGNPFPISVNPFNTDFIVMAHEFGHNFGSPHTHDYEPAIDLCAYGLYTNQGTLMSYCHICDGNGYLNISTFFHPTVINVMRQASLASCLPAFEGIAANVDLGFAKSGSLGFPVLEVDYQAGALDFDVTSAPQNAAGILAVSPNQANLTLFGGTFVPSPDILVPVTSDASGDVGLGGPVPAGVSFPAGQFFYSQAWFDDPAGASAFAATNGAEFEIILP